MVLASSTPQFFQPAEPQNADWHQNSTSDPTALCGAVVMRYNIDNTADSLPGGAKLCARCKWIAEGKPEVLHEPLGGPEVVSIPVPEGQQDDGKVGGEDGAAADADGDAATGEADGEADGDGEDGEDGDEDGADADADGEDRDQP